MGLSDGIAGRRDELTIMTDLMANMLQPMRSTHLLYKSNLSYSQLKKYLSSLQSMGLVEEATKPYRSFTVTEKGRTFLDIVGARGNGRGSKLSVEQKASRA
jgi:predicted transcriptional regulator